MEQYSCKMMYMTATIYHTERAWLESEALLYETKSRETRQMHEYILYRSTVKAPWVSVIQQVSWFLWA